MMTQVRHHMKIRVMGLRLIGTKDYILAPRAVAGRQPVSLRGPSVELLEASLTIPGMDNTQDGI